jgi:hypothetical protein
LNPKDQYPKSYSRSFYLGWRRKYKAPTLLKDNLKKYIIRVFNVPPKGNER